MQFQRYFEISQANNIKTFERLLLNTVEDMEFGLFSVLMVQEDPLDRRQATVQIVHNTPPAHHEAFHDKGAIARSPVIKRFKSFSVPFTWDREMHVAESAADLWEQAAPHGYKVGMAVALHLPHHQHFVLSMDRDAPLPKSDKKISRMLADLQLLTVYAEVAARRLMFPLLEHGVPKLSARELESLRWTLEGKTAWEVGIILAISERSVVFHLSNSMRKLGAVNKHQAALKALQLGLIY